MCSSKHLQCLCVCVWNGAHVDSQVSDYLTSCAGFLYSALNSSACILGFLLKLGHCGTAQGHDWAGAFFRPIDFFFLLLMHMK